MSDANAGDVADGPVQVELDVSDGRTLVTLAGQRNAAVIVESESGERIYLPPEESDGGETSPYRPTEGDDSPYQGIGGDDTPYGSSRRSDPAVGLNATADGFRIVHPEPVTDVRLVR